MRLRRLHTVYIVISILSTIVRDIFCLHKFSGDYYFYARKTRIPSRNEETALESAPSPFTERATLPQDPHSHCCTVWGAWLSAPSSATTSFTSDIDHNGMSILINAMRTFFKCMKTMIYTILRIEVVDNAVQDFADQAYDGFWDISLAVLTEICK